MSLVSWETPWNPATRAIAPASSAARIRPGVTSMIRALPCEESVMTPACEPVNERASAPSEEMAIATSALEIRSPEVSSMSSSRAGGTGATCCARSSRVSVVSPIAETTTTTSWPALRVSTMRSATRLMRSAEATDDPPYFWTIRLTELPTTVRTAGGRADPTTGGRAGRMRRVACVPSDRHGADLRVEWPPRDRDGSGEPRLRPCSAYRPAARRFSADGAPQAFVLQADLRECPTARCGVGPQVLAPAAGSTPD